MKKFVLVLCIFVLSLSGIYATEYEAHSEITTDGYTCVLSNTDNCSVESSIFFIIYPRTKEYSKEILEVYPKIIFGKNVGLDFPDESALYSLDFTGNADRNNYFGMVTVNHADIGDLFCILAAHSSDGMGTEEELVYAVKQTRALLSQIFTKSTHIMVKNLMTQEKHIIKVEVDEDSAKNALADLNDFFDLIY